MIRTHTSSLHFISLSVSIFHSFCRMHKLFITLPFIATACLIRRLSVVIVVSDMK